MEDNGKQSPSAVSNSFHTAKDISGRIEVEQVDKTPQLSQIAGVNAQNTHSAQQSIVEVHDNGPQPRHEVGGTQNPGTNAEPETRLTEQDEYDDNNVADIQVDLDNQRQQNSYYDMQEQYDPVPEARHEDSTQNYKVQTVEEESSMSSIEEVEDAPDEKAWVPMSNV